MITLIQYAPALGLPTASPFCTKLEALLAHSGLDYEVEVWNDPRKAPKGKLPAISDEGKLIGDTHFIQKHIEQKYGVDFNQGLSPEERAVAHAFRTMCEEHLYWGIVQSRWFEEANWSAVMSAYFSDIPALLRPFVVPMLRRQARAQIDGQGMGRHSKAEIYELCSNDLSALATQIGEGPFVMGEVRSAVDATVYGFLKHILEVELESPLKSAAKAHPSLRAYVDRLELSYFGDKNTAKAA